MLTYPSKSILLIQIEWGGGGSGNDPRHLMLPNICLKSQKELLVRGHFPLISHGISGEKSSNFSLKAVRDRMPHRVRST